MAEICTRGRLLLATPPLVDPNFDRTVVFMIEHNPDGALGVVVNRPMLHVGIPAEGLPGWTHLVTPPSYVFCGGPVSVESVIVLGRRHGRSHPSDGDSGWSEIDKGVGTVDLTRSPEDFNPGLQAIRVFAGYSGWAPGQLEGELDASAWIVLDAEPRDVFTDEPDGLWRSVLRRQGGRLAWVAGAPDDLSAN